MPRRNERRTARWVQWTFIAVVVVAVFAGGWSAAEVFQSPAQREASAQAPAPVHVTAAVVRGDLRRSITTDVVLQRQHRQSLALAATSDFSVVTAEPVSTGDEVLAGHVVAEVNGRPVFAMPGAFAFYRDLSTGLIGRDVRQLQAALVDAGFTIEVDGRFGASTGEAVRAVYERAGYAIASPDVRDPEENQSRSSDSDETGSESDPPLPVLTADVFFPRSEVTVMSSASARMVNPLQVGQAVGAETRIVVEQGPVVGVAEVSPSTGSEIRKNMRGTVTLDGQRHAVVVTSVAPGAQDADTKVEVAPAAGEIPDVHPGVKTLLDLDIDVVERDSLLVPTISVVTGGTGQSHVQKLDRSGHFVSVPVVESGQLEGQSAITSTGASGLTVGDRVRVG